MIPTKLRAEFGYLTTISGAVPIFVKEAIEAEAARRRDAGEPTPRGPNHQPTPSDVFRDVLVAWALGPGGRCGVPHPSHGVCARERGHQGMHDSHPNSVFPRRWTESPFIGGLGSDE